MEEYTVTTKLLKKLNDDETRVTFCLLNEVYLVALKPTIDQYYLNVNILHRKQKIT